MRILFVTGRLAEPSLRRVVTEVAATVGFTCEIAVLPITVAALLTTSWVARHLTIPAGFDRVILPGLCQGELTDIPLPEGTSVERGPKDLRDIPELFGKRRQRSADYGRFDIRILAEINHAPKLTFNELLSLARRHRQDGADIIDLGCDPGSIWEGLGEAVRELRRENFAVSVDSFQPQEVEAALEAGAELVLSVNHSNRNLVRGWADKYGNLEVVALPDTPSDLNSLQATIDVLQQSGVRFRIDPIVEPIGFGFAASLGRFIEARRRWPDLEMMMGVGNLTELTDVDSAGINVLLAGFCQELGIRSVLTTEVIPWCRNAVKEFDLARRLVFHAVHAKTLPKHLEPGLILLRDPKLHHLGENTLSELASQITDRNYRIFAERGEIHIMNSQMYLKGNDPFTIFEQLLQQDAKMDASHAFYIGYEMAKAITALTLNKNYTQDQALQWGFLTIPEVSHR